MTDEAPGSAPAACNSCRAVKPGQPCPLCGEPVCRKCRVLLPGDAFAAMPESERAPELRHPVYCPACYDREVQPALDLYEATVEAARQVNLIPKSYRGPLRLLQKATRAVEATGCEDRNEAQLKVAFQAARLGHNAVIQYEAQGVKTRDPGGYQRTVWSARGVPATIPDEKRKDAPDWDEEDF